MSWLTSSVFHRSWPKPEGQRELWSITLTASMTMTEWKNKVFFICHLLPKMIRHKILSKMSVFLILNKILAKSERTEKMR